MITRTPGGELILIRRLHVTASRIGTTHGAHAHHVERDGLSACSGVLLDNDGAWWPLSRLSDRELCQRRACRKIWEAER